jgi:hypothetical protein
MDPDLYNKCEEEYESQCLEKQHQSQERQERWKSLQEAAKQARLLSPQQNHTNSKVEGAMQIDTVVNIPERIPEELEPPETEGMTVDNTPA